MLSARDVIGTIGNVIAFFVFLSPLPTFINISDRGAVGGFSEIPYLASFINCGIWMLYGLPQVHPNSILVLVISVVGFVIEMVYLVLFYKYSAGEQKTRVRNIAVAEALFVALLGIGLLCLVTSTEMRSRIVGIIGVCTNIIVYGSPLSVLRDVLRTRNVENMPFFPSLFGFLNAIIWTIYSFIPYDQYLAIPNLTGLVLELFQLIIYVTIKLINNWYRETQMPRRIPFLRRANV